MSTENRQVCTLCGADGHLAAQCHWQPQISQAWIDVQAERRRQIDEEGWTLEHDDQNSSGELAQAAAAYLIFAFSRSASDRTYAARLWPRLSGFNPKGIRQDLVRACALALAELERLDRATAPPHGGE